jgi:AcrR family transcriptional regulator
MPRSRGPTRQRILDAAYKLFRARGYARVSMDDIAAAATITKRTLYRHFKSKDVILGEVLEAQSQLALAASRTFSHRSESSDDLVDALFADIVTWSETPRWSGSGFTRLVIELADFPGHPARAIARKHKAMLETHVANQLKRLNVASPVERARQIWLLAEGAMVSMLIHQDPIYVKIASGAAKKLLHSEQA